jgi:DNA replication protein DnaC
MHTANLVDERPSQLPIEKWHEYIADPTLADAILDRIVHDAYKINLKGESMRKRKSKIRVQKKAK